MNVPPASINSIKSLLTRIKHTIKVDDIQSLIDTEKSHDDKIIMYEDSDDAIFQKYQDANDYVSFLENLDGATRVSIGRSYLNQSIDGVRFGRGRHNIFFHGGIHARYVLVP